ncbi:MAG: selenide,water dikinase [Chlamydiales bacterium]|jgi:selenide,water dikinase
MPMGQLAQVLRDVSAEADERLLVGPQTFDDAGVVLLGEEYDVPGRPRTAVVQTVDYFPPIVDDPYAYGAIAAANALSDVYAMGGRPLSALNLAGFPEDFPKEWVAEIFRGGFEKVREAGAVIAGGHTVTAEEPLFGFSITGLIDPERVMTNAGAQVGDVIYLTKALGMGSLTTGAKFGKVTPEAIAPAAVQMATLNSAAAEAMGVAAAHACTDVTGFGLVGHSHNIARASEVSLRFVLDDLPFFPGTVDLARAGVFSGARTRGKQAMGEHVRVADGLDEARVDLTYDAETSGGLLIVLPADRAGVLESELGARNVPVHRVGEVLERGSFDIEFV